MSDTGRLESVLRNERSNAIVAWVLTVFVLFVVAGSLVEGNTLWAGLAAFVAGLVVLPPIVHRTPMVMVPWEVLALSIVPLVGRVFATVPLTSRFATYLAVASLALVIAMELHLFTQVEMSTGFAVLFVVVATMATAGVWAVTRWGFDIVLGTTFMLDPTMTAAEIEHGLMWEFVWSTAAGIVGGAVFEGYFRRIRLDDRRPASRKKAKR